MPHDPLTDLSQEALVWIAGFADALRVLEPRFGAEDASHDANELARGVWEQGELRGLAPEAAAQRWWPQAATQLCFDAPHVPRSAADGHTL